MGRCDRISDDRTEMTGLVLRPVKRVGSVLTEIDLKARKRDKLRVGQLVMIKQPVVIGECHRRIAVRTVKLLQPRGRKTSVRPGAVTVEIGFILRIRRQKIAFHAVGACDQRVIGVYIIEHLDIGRIPNVVAPAELFGKGLDAVPVVIVIELVAVTPEIKHLRMIAVFDRIDRQFGKTVGKLEKMRVFMMTGRGELYPVVHMLRKIEALGRNGRAEIANVGISQNLKAHVVILTERIRAAADDHAEQLFKRRIEIKRAAKPVFFHNLDKAGIMHRIIVVA